MVKRKNPTSVRLLCYELGLRILIPQDTHVGCAPLDLDSMPSPALHSAATGPLAQITCIWLGAGSSGAMRLKAAWASVKIVTLSGVVCRLATIYSTLVRAHSAP